MKVKSNITGGETERIFLARLLGKYDVGFFRCCETGYIQTETPYWLGEAYASSMNLSDTGILTRNAYFSGILRAFLGVFFLQEQSFLDYAGGYGVLTRMMRDAGFDYYWCDPYTQNLTARGFEHVDGQRAYAAVSAIEVFEHLANPREEIAGILKLAPMLVFSTVLVPEPWPQPLDWWYYGLEHGQHISFYTRKALEVVAHAHGASLATNGKDIHAFVPVDILPLEVEADWMRCWLEHEGLSYCAEVDQAYEFLPTQKQKPGWRIRFKNFARAADPLSGVYVLRVVPGSAFFLTLVGSGLAITYASYLLSGGRVDALRLAGRFPSRTESDSKALLQSMLAAGTVLPRKQ